MMFAECGMAVYETIGSVWVAETSEKGGNRVSSYILRLRERMEQLQQNLYAIQEAMEEMSIEETTQGARLEEWVGHVEETLDILVNCKWGSGLLKSRLCFLTSKNHKQDYKQRGTTTWG